jgi:hypothetical protein
VVDEMGHSMETVVKNLYLQTWKQERQAWGGVGRQCLSGWTVEELHIARRIMPVGGRWTERKQPAADLHPWTRRMSRRTHLQTLRTRKKSVSDGSECEMRQVESEGRIARPVSA